MKHAATAVLLLLAAPAAIADVSSFDCFKGSNVSCKQLKRGNDYVLAAYGSWLDITNSVSAPSGITASIMDKGGGPANPRVRIRLQISSSCSPGDKRITMRRPALGGTDSDTVAVTVVE